MYNLDRKVSPYNVTSSISIRILPSFLTEKHRAFCYSPRGKIICKDEFHSCINFLKLNFIMNWSILQIWKSDNAVSQQLNTDQSRSFFSSKGFFWNGVNSTWKAVCMKQMLPGNPKDLEGAGGPPVLSYGWTMEQCMVQCCWSFPQRLGGVVCDRSFPFKVS